MTHKLLMGYQGWFTCPGDGSGFRSQWRGWGSPAPSTVMIDFWPDTRELDSDERCKTPLTLPDGSPAYLYSAYNHKTVDRHFKWMADSDLDGVFLQRFTFGIQNPKIPQNFQFINQVAQNVRAGAEAHGRVFAIMYAISQEDDPNTLFGKLEQDWTYLVDTLHITDSPQYLRHHGRPVLAIWGFGFYDEQVTPGQAAKLISYFRSEAAPRYRVTLLGGVPAYWRTLNNDSQTDPAWANVYRSLDIISPWSVTRYKDEVRADQFAKNVIIPDLAEAKNNGKEYMPVVFPGFSKHNHWENIGNSKRGNRPLQRPNRIPRNGGRFYWRQVYNSIKAGNTMLYGAMFDEVNEGTAMYKTAPTAAQMPAQGSFVPLNIDGYALPSDWYLRLAGAAGKMLRREIPLSPAIPIAP